MILADTSVWIDFFQRNAPDFQEQIASGAVVMHPFVEGELVLGGLPARYLSLLGALPRACIINHEIVTAFVTNRGLIGSGIGWVDAHLLAAALSEKKPILTLDRALGRVARRLGCSV